MKKEVEEEYFGGISYDKFLKMLLDEQYLSSYEFFTREILIANKKDYDYWKSMFEMYLPTLSFPYTHQFATTDNNLCGVLSYEVSLVNKYNRHHNYKGYAKYHFL